jgi:hypothetical protein
MGERARRREVMEVRASAPCEGGRRSFNIFTFEFRAGSMSGDSNPVSETPLEAQGDPGQGEGHGPEGHAGGAEVSGDADPGAQGPDPEDDDGAGAADPPAGLEAEFAALQAEHESLRSQ